MSTPVTNLAALGLHTAAPGTVCACGPCKHRVRQLAARLGITPEVLLARLKVTAPPVGRPTRPVRPRHGGIVAERATVTLDGVKYTGTDAVLAAVRALRE